MCDQMGSHTAIREVHQMEPRGTRWKIEIYKTDEVAMYDARAVSLQGFQGSRKQVGSDGVGGGRVGDGSPIAGNLSKDTP